MNWRIFRSYLFVLVTAPILLALVLLIVLQWGNTCTFSFYGKNLDKFSMVGLIAGSLIAGAIAPKLIAMFLRSFRDVQRHRRQKDVALEHARWEIRKAQEKALTRVAKEEAKAAAKEQAKAPKADAEQ